MKICENCGNEHDGSYGSGRFCSNHCRHVFIGKQTKKHICNFQNTRKKSPYGTWKCDKCDLIFETRRQLQEHNHQKHPIPKRSSWNKGLTKASDTRVAKYVNTCKKRGHYVCPTKGKPLSEEHKAKTSASLKKFYLEHPDKVPYVLNHSSKESYPEKYFKKIFIKEYFPSFVQDKYVNGYFLDFAFESSMTYIEIDGEQHYVDKKIVKHDEVRKENLSKTEWKCVCRIRWSKFKKLTNTQKHKFIIGLKNKLNSRVLNR